MSSDAAGSIHTEYNAFVKFMIHILNRNIPSIELSSIETSEIPNKELLKKIQCHQNDFYLVFACLFDSIHNLPIQVNHESKRCITAIPKIPKLLSNTHVDYKT